MHNVRIFVLSTTNNYCKSMKLLENTHFKNLNQSECIEIVNEVSEIAFTASWFKTYDECKQYVVNVFNRRQDQQLTTYPDNRFLQVVNFFNKRDYDNSNVKHHLRNAGSFLASAQLTNSVIKIEY